MLMLAYACLHWDFENNRPRADSTGDNLYYLGFLYTLTSLAARGENPRCIRAAMHPA